MISVHDGSGQQYDRSRGHDLVFTGSPCEGDISGEISFLFGTYKVQGRSVFMEILSGHGPEWLLRRYHGVITGMGAMQGRYEGESVPYSDESVVTFSGTWWAIKKQ